MGVSELSQFFWVWGKGQKKTEGERPSEEITGKDLALTLYLNTEDFRKRSS